MKFAPYILGVVGLMVSANKIYSILMKKKYRHEKNFYVAVGEEVTSNMVFPIKFIEEERVEGEIILKRLFLSENFNEMQFKEGIKEAVDSMNKKDIQKLQIYFQGESSRNRVEQYIFKKLIMKQIDSKEEKSTKRLFDSIKEDWPEFIEYENGSFKINEIELENLLERVQENPLEETLLPEINLELLKKTLIVHATRKHELDYLERKVDIQIKMKTKRNFLWKFLKRDLERIPYSERSRMVYGINYRIQGSELSVSGVPDADFDGKVLVLQIISEHQRIMKELWIHGVSSLERNENKKRASYAIVPKMSDESYNVI